ncbi:glycogen synthase [Pedobacter alpinus]|uniref:Glycogen synthase n=1 Tax=Pedobacter alpinus TaxID=1590643 RepID=A0ABW5TQ16_9SPHI
MMNVLHLSAECYPVAKAGGLGDVVGALPKYQVGLGLNAMVVMPYYERKFVTTHSFETVFESSSKLGFRSFDFQILKETNNILGFELYLVKIPELLDRPEIYSYPDETEQFVAFQIAVLEWIVASNKQIDVFHCHDHHTGLVPYLIQHSGKFNSLAKTPSVFTIHNGQYQGWMSWEKFYYLPEVEASTGGLLEWKDCINPLAAAIKCCWKYTTVSPSYLLELNYNSNGLEFLFELEGQKGVGILNGIDVEVWNPKTDPMLNHNYQLSTVKSGKEKNKKDLCTEFGLDPNLPLFTFIGRLVVEKGAEMLAELIKEIFLRNQGQVCFMLLGSGDKQIENDLKEIQSYLTNYNCYIGYDETLSHKIYASADFIFMPSRVEPCGLNQLYALRYGTVPIVRSTGGLKDSVIDIIEREGYGIRFDNLDIYEMIHAVERGLNLYQDVKKLNQVRKNMMSLDFSWTKSAEEYYTLYKSLI